MSSLWSRSLIRASALAAVLATAGCGDPQIIVPDIMTIVAILPNHGASDVSPQVEPLVYFSHAAADQGEVERSVSLQCLGAPDGGSCAAPTPAACGTETPSFEVTYEPAAQLAKVTPGTALLDDTCYVLVVAEGIDASDPNVGPLPVTVRSSFKTR